MTHQAPSVNQPDLHACLVHGLPSVAYLTYEPEPEPAYSNQSLQYLQTVQEDGENTEDRDRKTQAKTEQEDGENTEDRDRRGHACALRARS